MKMDFPPVSYSPSAQHNINISPYFSAPGRNFVSAEHNRDIHYGFCQTIKNMLLDASAVIIRRARGR